MTPLGIFGRGKKAEKKEAAARQLPEKEPAQKTLLDELCGNDTELGKVLSRALLLNPKVTDEHASIDSYIERAQQCEKNKDYVRARIEYQAAAELALYEGKLAQVQKLFKKAADVDSNYPHRGIFEYFMKKENAEKALAIAHEYYARTAKATQR